MGGLLTVALLLLTAAASRPPAPAPGPIYPTAGSETEGKSSLFRWVPPVDPDGEPIADYHWQLSDQPDMRWSLSPSFGRLISRTPRNGKAQYALPYVGMLAPDHTYYWRVRARDAAGLWEAWSEATRTLPSRDRLSQTSALSMYSAAPGPDSDTW